MHSPTIVRRNLPDISCPGHTTCRTTPFRGTQVKINLQWSLQLLINPPLQELHLYSVGIYFGSTAATRRKLFLKKSCQKATSEYGETLISIVIVGVCYRAKTPQSRIILSCVETELSEFASCLVPAKHSSWLERSHWCAWAHRWLWKLRPRSLTGSRMGWKSRQRLHHCSFIGSASFRDKSVHYTRVRNMGLLPARSSNAAWEGHVDLTSRRRWVSRKLNQRKRNHTMWYLLHSCSAKQENTHALYLSSENDVCEQKQLGCSSSVSAHQDSVQDEMITS